MGNKNINKYYRKMANNIKSPQETRNKAKDFSKYDIELMKENSHPEKTLLDLGSGTGLLINNLIDYFKHITAIEKYQEFSKYIIKNNKINVVNTDLLEFKINLKYDVVSLFGVMNYFNIHEANHIYKKVFDYLKTDGVLIIKNQMGISKDIIINGYSKELDTDYYSEYRFVDKEIDILQKIGFNKIEKVDIYPKEFNRWSNTHFYALVCKK